MNKKLINLLLITTIAISCCKKEPRPKEERRYGPTYFGKYADYFMFKPGSIWIYENNRTGELDTCDLWAIERDTPTFFYEDRQYKIWYTKEKIDFDIASSIRYKYYKNSPSISTIIPYRTTIPCLNCGLSNIDSTLKFTIKRFSGDFVFYNPYNYNGAQNGYYPTYTVGNETFYEVYRFDIGGGGLPPWDYWKLPITATSASYYWAKDVGLIQIMYQGVKTSTINDTAYWQLKNYQVQKF
jgi:hypothetical protein